MDLSLLRSTPASLYQRAVEQADDYVIFLVSPSAVLATWTPAVERTLGWPEAAFIGQPFAMLFVADDRESGLADALVAEARAHGQARYQRLHRRADGSTCSMRGRIARLEDASGLLAFVVSLQDVSAIVEAEARHRVEVDDLRQQVRAFETLLDVIPLGIAVARNPEATQFRSNKALSRLLRMPAPISPSLSAPDNERPTHFRVLRDGVDSSPDQLPLQQSAATGRAVEDVELEIVFESGDRVRLLESASPLFDDTGAVRGSVAVFVDVTERAAAEAHFRRLADFAPVLIWTAGLDKACNWFNKPWLEFTGRSIDQELGFGWADGVHPDDYATCVRTYTEAFDQQRAFRIEYRLRRHDGVYRWVLDVGTPAVDARGELTGYVGSCLDITEQRDAAAALAASEQHFRMLADHAPVMIWQTDPSGACTFLNQRWYLFTGQTPEQGLGFGWLDAVHPDQREAAAATFKNATDDAGTSQMEYRLRHHSGEYFWAIDSATPHYDGDGVFRGYIGSVTDISDRKAVEEQRERLLLAEREARHEAERTNLIKDEFLAGLSHELRTPLNAILGWAHVLHGNDGLSDETRHGLAIIERNARLQTRLIEDLLDMSRILSGKLRLDVQQVHIATVVEAAVETIRPSAEARGLRLVTVLDPHAGPVAGDPMRLQQVVWNLLSNAVKFTERGGKIEVVLERVNSHLEVSVTDTGVGIRPDFLPHVFERFRQADGSITRSYGGLGIGLSIVKHLVELHGGSVRAKSPGEHRGATFIVALPVLALRQHDDDRGGQHPESPGATRREPDATALAGVSVLVVEDDDDSRALIAAMLTACGATVTQAASAAAALEALEPNPPDVLISDIGLPGRDGYELLRTLRRSEGAARSVPALALTAYARSEDRRQALLAGFQLHMAKPVEPDELCTAVASLARRL